MSFTITGCYNTAIGEARFTNTCCFHPGCYVETSGIHEGQIAVTIELLLCEDVFYGCYDSATGKFEVIVDDSCACNMEKCCGVLNDRGIILTFEGIQGNCVQVFEVSHPCTLFDCDGNPAGCGEFDCAWVKYNVSAINKSYTFTPSVWNGVDDRCVIDHLFEDDCDGVGDLSDLGLSASSITASCSCDDESGCNGDGINCNSPCTPFFENCHDRLSGMDVAMIWSGTGSTCQRSITWQAVVSRCKFFIPDQVWIQNECVGFVFRSLLVNAKCLATLSAGASGTIGFGGVASVVLQ